MATTYGDSYFNGGGAGYPGYLNEDHLLRERGRWYAGQLARHMSVGNVLDIGAAAGFILKGLEDAGWRGAGIEPNETMARYAREVLGLHVVTAQLQDFLTGTRFDLVSMIQVIAHIADSRRAMAQVVDLRDRTPAWKEMTRVQPAQCPSLFLNAQLVHPCRD